MRHFSDPEGLGFAGAVEIFKEIYMKAVLRTKIFVATLLMGSLASADLALKGPKIETPSEKALNAVISSLLQKIGAIENLKFDINIDSTLSGLPIGDSSVSLSVPLMDEAKANIGIIGDSKNPNLFIGRKDLMIVVDGQLKRDADNIKASGSVSFKDERGRSSYMPVTVAIDKYPNLKIRTSGISVSSELSANVDTGSKAFPLGEALSGNCQAEVRIGQIVKGGKTEETWKSLDKCSFSATYNKETQRYDVKARFANN